MPRMQMGLSSYERARGDLPASPNVNMTVEAAPTEESGIAMQSRPGLEDRDADMGAGPVLALFQRDNVLGTALFGVSDGKLYEGTTNRGSIDGDGPFSIAGYENFVFTAGGAGLWGWNGSALAEIVFPDDADVAKVIVAASRVVAIRKDTGQFYWSDPLETDIEALDFATAESQPDRLKDCLFLDNTLLLFGAETVEFWPGTGDAQLPFQPLQGRVIERGIRATGCAVNIGPTFAWVTNQNQVCLQDENTVISNPGLQAKIAASTACSLWTFLLDGVEYLALRLDTETHVWSWRARTWSKFESYGQANWIPQCFAGGVFGSAIDGRTIAWGADYSDFGGVLVRSLRAGYPLNSGGFNVANVQLRCNVGQTPFLTGDYTNPQVEMAISRDAGQTFGAYRATSLGAQGNYRTKVQWRACGMASQPGFLAEFRVSDPVPWRVSDCLVNEPYGGR